MTGDVVVGAASRRRPLLWLGERIAAVAQRLNEAARIRPGNHPAPVVVSRACRCPNAGAAARVPAVILSRRYTLTSLFDLGRLSAPSFFGTL